MAKKTRVTAQVRSVEAGAARSAPTTRVQVTLGDLIVAAFDTVGGEARKATRVLSSRSMTLATGRHIVVVG